MLSELVKKDNYWRQVAFNICKCKTLADDLTQEMYLKLSNHKKEINDFYVVITIRNIFLDLKRKEQRNRHVELNAYDLKQNNSLFEPNDYEEHILSEFNDLEWFEKEIITELYYKSLRELSNELVGIDYGFIYRTHKKAIKKILKQDIDLYKNKRRKN